MAAETTRYAVEIPKLGSLILTHDWEGEVRGLSDWPADERPNAEVLFWSFRVMVGLGFAMLALGAWSLALRWRGRLYDTRSLLLAALAMAPMGFVAVLAGWITTEMGRQPYTVQGLLRTEDSASPLDAPAVASSLGAFAVVYIAVFGAGIFYILRSMAQAPGTPAADLPRGEPIRAAGITPAPAMGRHPGKEGGNDA
jgi:cytochrome d ubiquinol oxidase subunit I